MFLYSLVYFISVDLLSQTTNCLFLNLWQHGREKYNLPIATEYLYGESLSHKGFSGTFGEIREKISFAAPKMSASMPVLPISVKKLKRLWTSEFCSKYLAQLSRKNTLHEF